MPDAPPNDRPPGAATRVALLSPTAFPAVSGNAVTVGRIARRLAARALAVRVWDLSATPRDAIAGEAAAFGPTVVHAFHAFRAGPLGAELAARLGVPLVVTVTGTDVNRDLDDPARARVVRRALEAADAVTVFHDSMLGPVGAALPDGAARVSVVPQSVDFEPGPSAAAPALPDGGPVVLFPAGIRAVKRPRFPVGPLEALRARFPGLTLVYAGPVVEAAEGAALARELAGRPWARHLGAVPHAAMPELLRRACLVLNCSLSEGGMANSVLEALAMGRAVLASSIDGNRSLVEDGVTGALFRTADEFAERAGRLLADPALRAALGEAGRRYVEGRFGPEREVEGYLTLYRHFRRPARDVRN